MANSIIPKSLASDVALSYIPSASITILNSKISNLERAYVRKFGKVVVVDLTFTVSETISEVQAELFSGFPKAYEGNQRFRLQHGYSSNYANLVLAITTGGKIINQWSHGGIQAGQWQGQFVYITSE